MLYKPVHSAFRANERTIRDLIEMITQEEFEYKDKEIILQSETFHHISKNGGCWNYSFGYTSEKDGGKTYMTISGGVLMKICIEYVIYAHPNEYGVDTRILKITDGNDVIYQAPEQATDAILLY